MNKPHHVSLCHWVAEAELPKLLALLTAADEADEIALDLGQVKWWMPGAVVAVISRAHRWINEGRKVKLLNYRSCEAFSYLQRVDFFKQLGVVEDESFIRHPEGGRFLPVRRMSFGGSGLDKIASDMARCVVPGADWEDDTFQLVQYALGEIMANAVQHSGGVAWVSAQYTPKNDVVRVAVADDGGGILGSFVGTPLHQLGMSAQAAIGLAVEPRISSGRYRTVLYGRPHNRGIGLSMVDELVGQSLGHLLIGSGDGWRHRDGQREPRLWTAKASQQLGTLVCASFMRGQVLHYREMHRAALEALGLFSPEPEDMFE